MGTPISRLKTAVSAKGANARRPSAQKVFATQAAIPGRGGLVRQPRPLIGKPDAGKPDRFKSENLAAV